MKLTKLFTLIAILCVSGNLSKTYAQVDLTVNPIGLLWGNFSVGADFNVSEKFSVEGSVGFGSRKFDSANYKWSNIPISVLGKYYFSPDNGCDKFYADAFLLFINRSYKSIDDNNSTFFYNYTQTRFGLGFGLGYKVASKSGLVFDINMGIGRAIVDNTKYEDENGVDTSVDWSDIMFQGKLGVGYRFGGK